MGKSKKPFIDRKKAVTFHLVHRSQHDPLVTDETAPQHVLVEAPSKTKRDDTDDFFDNSQKRREEQQKYGILFDDDYNYLQHLKKPEQDIAWEYVENPNQTRKRLEQGKITTMPKLKLPSSVFATEFEEDEGMLNKAAPRPGPRPDWDPDIVAALDDDFDFRDEANELEDDFVVKAMEGDEEENEWLSEKHEHDNDDECSIDSNQLYSDIEDEKEMMDTLGPLMRKSLFDEEETRSRFTEYSMSSSVLRRNDQLTLLDDRFEKFYASYDDQDVGDLSMEEIEGNWGQKHPFVLGCFKEFKKSNKCEEYNKEWDKDRLEKYRYVTDGDQDLEEELIEYEVEDPKEKKFDCESILSTYSNIYNHPKMINEPRRQKHSSVTVANPDQTKIAIDMKTGLPMNVLRGGENNQLTAKALSKLEGNNDASAGPRSLCDKSILSTLSVLSIRPKDETPEEKKERKRLLRGYRSERRIERKANAEAFKEEKKRQIQIKLNQRNNLQGNRIL